MADQPPAQPTDWSVQPFSSHYVAEWKDISVGVSDLNLTRDTEPDHYVYKWTISARGIFKIVYSDDVVQQSWFSIADGKVRPDRYRGQEGSKTVNFDFDWNAGRARGTSEGKQVDIALAEGAQDLMSIQLQVMLDLQNGNMPPTFHIIDKDELKEFIYTREGEAKLETDLGTLDTLIVQSKHFATDRRVLRMWFAPSLGYIPVQAERLKDGKLEFAMRIKTLTRNGVRLPPPDQE
jgi:hypothetical protein